MPIKEIAKNGVRGTLSNIFLFQETKVLKLAADNYFGKQYFFSLQRVRKLLSSDRHRFLSLFVSIGVYISIVEVVLDFRSGHWKCSF